MAEHADREHYIPLRFTDLVELLGRAPTLTDPERESFRALAKLLSAVFHFESHQRLEELKEAYAPFDPDEDVKLLSPWSPEERRRRQEQLFARFDELLRQANYVRLTREKLEAAFSTVSAWGIPMEVDFSQFERLEVYARGDIVGKRTRKNWRTRWKEQTLDVEVLQRVVVIVKLKKSDDPKKALFDTDHIFIKIFKEIPKADLEMLLPGAKVRFSNVDKSKIGFPVVSGLGIVGWNLLKLAGIVAVGGAAGSTMMLWGAAAGTLGYGWRTYSSYNFTKNQYSLQLTRSLYYQNLDNNAGVLFRILDAAEEQECREALLAYFFLWRQAGEEGWTPAQLDDAIEAHLEKEAGLKVDFEIGDAMAKLIRLGLVAERPEGRHAALPIAAALVKLDETWDNYFKYANDA